MTVHLMRLIVDGMCSIVSRSTFARRSHCCKQITTSLLRPTGQVLTASHEKLEFERVNTHGMLFTWPGSNPELKPIVRTHVSISGRHV